MLFDDYSLNVKKLNLFGKKNCHKIYVNLQIFLTVYPPSAPHPTTINVATTKIVEATIGHNIVTGDGGKLKLSFLCLLSFVCLFVCFFFGVCRSSLQVGLKSTDMHNPCMA